ncbi:pancreatic polypeptide prohormone isoform X1 [Lagenorhynchus albirostris]|uniref:pancreatic polypeptide prohormone isoform X1 n=1 Tax=Lagenorhynchus albirostris TaxID=27610 RepID=UPI0028F073F9|nr:pancreatic polypeptide prohormone isoform X1 [Lagenorhynchus albirostris]
MAASHRCLFLLLLSTGVALLLRPPLGARGAPLEPVYPGDNATPEQMAQYAAELRRYINMLTRPRYGKRDKEGALDFLECGSPHAAPPRWAWFPALCVQMPGAETGVCVRGGGEQGPRAGLRSSEGTRTPHSCCYTLPSPHRQLSPRDS